MDSSTNRNSKRIPDLLRQSIRLSKTPRRIYKTRYDINNNITNTKHFSRTKSDTAYPCTLTWTGQIRTLPQIATQILQHTQEQYTTTGNITVVTDASVIGDKGTWAIIFVDNKGKTITQRQGGITDKNITSFRAELDGCREAILMIKQFPNADNFKVYCDNKAVIHRLNHLRKGKPQIQWSDYDILLNISENLKNNTEFYHVKGHQSNNTQHNLTLETNLNILMDQRAKRAQYTDNFSNLKLNFSLEYNDKRITGSMITT